MCVATGSLWNSLTRPLTAEKEKGSYSGRCTRSSLCAISWPAKSVVTGASDVIGQECAIQFAKKGFSLLVITRNEAAPKSVTDDIG